MESASESPFEQLSGRRFAFYPAIRNIEHNEWSLEQETWSEILAKNTETGQTIWIPRGHLGKISSVDQPVLIVGLKRELELKAGEVTPFRSPVVAIPGSRATRSPTAAAEDEPPEPAQRETETDVRTLSLIGRAVAIGLGGLLLIVLIVSGNLPNPVAALFRTDISTTDQRYLSLSGQDGYVDVTLKVGEAEDRRWITKEVADLHFQLLRYPARSYTLVLMGGSRGDARYIGTLHDPTRKILDSTRLSGGGDTASMLQNLPDF